MKSFLLLICLVAFGFASILVSSQETADTFEREDGIVVLTDDNFQEALKHFDNILVEFYSPWCSHSQAFAPDYIKIASILKERGQNVVLAKIDATEEQESAEEHDIQGFPILKLFSRQKSPRSYKTFRSVDGIVDWVTRKIGPPAIELVNEEVASDFKESGDVVVVAYFKDVTSSEALTFLNVADQDDNCKFAITNKKEVADKLGFTKEGVKLFKTFDEKEVDFVKDPRSSAELKIFIQDNSLPSDARKDQEKAEIIIRRKPNSRFLNRMKRLGLKVGIKF